LKSFTPQSQPKMLGDTGPKPRIAQTNVPFETPGPAERTNRVAAVAVMIYLVFNEGYSAGNRSARSIHPSRRTGHQIRQRRHHHSGSTGIASSGSTHH
jgi:hypothetical protein